LYIENRPGGQITIKSTAVQALAIVGNQAVMLSKANLNGVGNYSFQATMVDNGTSGDQFGLKVTTPAGTVDPTLNYLPITLTGGNFQIPH
jgi:hypothetical protein